jgi:cobalt/nickel transport system permease protein
MSLSLSKKQKWVVAASIAFAICFGVMPAANAMHIMEGYLPASLCVFWGVMALPFVVWGFFSIRKTVNANRRTISLMAMAGAFIFVISSLKIPSVTGSCSHMTGTGLGALLFGPAAVAVLGLIVLLFQAILLAHGGLTTIGANCFSMAIAGPFVSFGLYKLMDKVHVNRKVNIFLACALGDLFTYCVTAVQMAWAHHSNVGFGAAFVSNMGVYAATQVPLAIIEGILSVIIIMALESYATAEMKAIGFLGGAE